MKTKVKIAIILMLFSCDLVVGVPPRKISVDKLQLTGIKDAEILKTDEKGNVVSSEICQAKIRGIDTLTDGISVPNVNMKNMEFYGQTRTELSATFITYSPDVEKAEDLKITLNLKKQAKLLYYPTEKGQVTYSESKDVFEGANDITNYVFENYSINEGETVNETWLSQGHKKFLMRILFDTIIGQDYTGYDLSKLLTVEKKTNRSICDRVNENTEKIKNTKTIYNSSGDLSGFKRGRYNVAYQNVYIPDSVIDAFNKRRLVPVFFLGRKFSENEYRSFVDSLYYNQGLHRLLYLSDEVNRQKSGLSIGQGVRLIDIYPSHYANDYAGSTVGLGGGTFSLENFRQSYEKDGIINNTIYGNGQGVDIFSSKISSNNENSSMQYSFTPDRFMIESRSGRDSVLFLDDKNKKYLLYAKNKDLTHSNSIVTRGLLDSLLNKKLSAETDPVFTAWDKDYNDLTHKPTAQEICEENIIQVKSVSYAASPFNFRDLSYYNEQRTDVTTVLTITSFLENSENLKIFLYSAKAGHLLYYPTEGQTDIDKRVDIKVGVNDITKYVHDNAIILLGKTIDEIFAMSQGNKEIQVQLLFEEPFTNADLEKIELEEHEKTSICDKINNSKNIFNHSDTIVNMDDINGAKARSVVFPRTLGKDTEIYIGSTLPTGNNMTSGAFNKPISNINGAVGFGVVEDKDSYLSRAYIKSQLVNDKYKQQSSVMALPMGVAFEAIQEGGGTRYSSAFSQVANGFAYAIKGIDDKHIVYSFMEREVNFNELLKLSNENKTATLNVPLSNMTSPTSLVNRSYVDSIENKLQTEIETKLSAEYDTVSINSFFVLEPSSAPSSAQKGTIYYDSTDNKLKCYDGTSWHNLY